MDNPTGSATADLGVSPAAAPPFDAWTATEAQRAAKTAALAKASAPPPPAANTPAAARARIEEMTRDPEFSAKLCSGNNECRREFDAAVEQAFSDRTERLLNGVTLPHSSDIDHGVTGTEAIAEIERKRALGVNEDVIAQQHRTEPVKSRAEFEWLWQRKQAFLNNREKTDRWMKGDPVCAAEWEDIQGGLINGYVLAAGEIADPTDWTVPYGSSTT